ncbi:MAG: hypothetical protein OXR67_08020 [Chloroflexota bacterium]|nr:hypothetical protein [Chloroflexota bacterium]
MMASVQVTEDASATDHQEAVDRLFILMKESGANTKGCLIQYIDPEEVVMIL